MIRRPGEEGMALVTVLLMVAVAAAALAIMMAGEDASLQRATRMGEAARARAIAQAGELSAIAALRRDRDLNSDNATEEWAKIGDKGSPIDGGRFELAIADAQGKLDLNSLVRGDPLTRLRLSTMVLMLRLPEGSADRIAERLAIGGPIADIAELGAVGLSSQELARLATLATALPVPSPINLNAAPEALLGLMLDNPVAARGLAARRARNGRLSEDDLALERVPAPAGTGFSSRLFWVRTRVTIGDTSQQLVSLLLRKSRPAGGSDMVVISRWRGDAGPMQAPQPQ